MRLISSSIGLASLAALLSACASLPQGSSHSGLDASAAGNTRYVSLANDAEIAEILASPMGEEAVVRLALFNSPVVRERLGSLSIGESDMRTAGLLPASPATEMPSDGEGLTAAVLTDLLAPLHSKSGLPDIQKHEADLTDYAVILIADVRNAWTRLAAAKQAHNLARMSEGIARTAEKVALELSENGGIPAEELTARRIALAKAQQAILAAEAERREAREELADLIGVELMGDWFVHNADPAGVRDTLPEIGLEAMVAGNMALKAEKAALASLATAHGIADLATVVPEIDIEALADRDDHAWEVGPSLELPTFTVKGEGAAHDKAEAELRTGQYNYAHDLVVTANRAALLLHERTATHKLVRLLNEQAAQAADQAVAASLRQYNAMQTGVFGLLAVRENAVEARRQQLAGWKQYRDAEVLADAARAGVVIY